MKRFLLAFAIVITPLAVSGCFGWNPYSGYVQEDEQRDEPYGDNTKDKD